MRFFSNLCFLLSLGCLLFSCAQENRSSSQKTTTPKPPAWVPPWQLPADAPIWIKKPTEDGRRMAACGIADFSPSETLSKQRERAQVSARDELSRMISVKIQNCVKDFLVESSDDLTTYFEKTSLQLSENTVNGSREIDSYTNPKTNDLYVWMEIDPGFAKKIATSVAQAAKNPSTGDPKLDAHLRAKAGSDEAFAELDRQLEKKLLGDGGAKK